MEYYHTDNKDKVLVPEDTVQKDTITGGVNIQKRELGGDQGYYQGPDGVPPSGGAIDHGMTAKRGDGREWDYPAVEETMDSAGIHPIGLYIKRRQTIIAQRVDCRPVYELCTEVDRMPVTSRMVRQ